MARRGTPSELLPNIVDWLQELLLAVSNFAAADRMWRLLLTKEEQRRLGGHLDAAITQHRNTVGVWMAVRNIRSQPLAIADLARNLDLLSDREYDRLRRELRAGPASESHPRWNAALGELRWGKQLIRRVRLFQDPSHIHRILDAFEESGWPDEVEDPLPEPRDAHRLHQAIRTLNSGLTRVRFHVAGGGTRISWKHAAARTKRR